MEKEKVKFETPEKPELETLGLDLDCSGFQNPEKAEALIKSLNLNVGDTIKEDDEERFTINPRIVLRGGSPDKYKRQVEETKKILTEKEKKGISLYYRRKKENQKIRDKLYDGITKRVENIYNWDDENKKHTPKKNSKRSIEICEALDWIHNSEQYHGFNNLIYHLLSKEEQDFVYCYKCAWFNKPIPNIQEWVEEDDGEYWVLTESEADYNAKEYLTDDTYLWTSSVEAGNTTDSLEDWADWVIQCDGRGSVLSGYDGCEEEEEIDGVDYYIYRTN